MLKNRSAIAVPLFALTFAISACAATESQAPPSEPEPLPPGDVEADDCVVGTWNLDVAAYASESEEYILGLGVPITGFALTGVGMLSFTPDGLVATDVALNTTGTIVAGETSVPVSVPSVYTASGDWSRTGDDRIQFDNWAKVSETDDIPPEVDVPSLDVTQLTDVAVDCTADELYLAAPGVPLGTAWTR